MSSFSYKGILSILVSVFLVSGILYASSTIISVQTQSIAQGDVIANGWFQEVNDSIVSIRNTLTSNTGNLWWKSWNDIYYTGGNVGIGTRNPNSILDITKDWHRYIKLSWQSWWSAFVWWNDDSASASLYWWSWWYSSISLSNWWVVIWTVRKDLNTSSHVNNFFVSSDGNVGIWITSPNAKLHIQNLHTVVWPSPYIQISWTSQHAIFALNAGWWNWNGITSVGDSVLMFSNDNNPTSANGWLVIAPWDYGTSGIKIMENWNVWIWTTTPWQKLSVAGTIESTSGWYKFPDGTVQTTASAGSSIPAGAIMAFNLSTCPTGWIAANGTSGTPDLRWEFIRWLDNGRWVDSGRTLGSWQVDMFKSHNHWLHLDWNTPSDAFLRFWTPSSTWWMADMAWAHSNTMSTWWTETRPRNIALLYCQKQ